MLACPCCLAHLSASAPVAKHKTVSDTVLYKVHATQSQKGLVTLLFAMGQSTSSRVDPKELDRASLRSVHSRRSDPPERAKDVADNGSRHRKEAKRRATSDRHDRKVKRKPYSSSFRRANIGVASRAAARNKQAEGYYARARTLSFYHRHVRESKTRPRSVLR